MQKKNAERPKNATNNAEPKNAKKNAEPKNGKKNVELPKNPEKEIFTNGIIPFYYDLNFQHWNISGVTHDPDDFVRSFFSSELRDKNQLEMIEALVREINLFTQRRGIDFVFIGGTALGAYRHHGVIPWDDDLDGYVRGMEYVEAMDAFRENDQFIVCPYDKDSYFKIALKGYVMQPKGTKYCPGWPFIDIWIIKDQGENLAINHFPSRQKNPTLYKKNMFYPLRQMAFMSSVIPVPNQLEAYLKKKYSSTFNENFKLHGWDHIRSKSRNNKETKLISRKAIIDYFPFSYNYVENAQRTEVTLKMKSDILYKLVVYQNKTVVLKEVNSEKVH